MKTPEFEMYILTIFDGNPKMYLHFLPYCIQYNKQNSKLFMMHYEYLFLYWEAFRGYWKGWAYSSPWDWSNFLFGDSLISFPVSCQFSKCQPNSFSPPASNLLPRKKWRLQKKTNVQTFKLVTLSWNAILSQ